MNIDFGKLIEDEYKRFDGDILITDPCYIKRSYDEWPECDYGYNFEIFGIKNYMTRDTIYGDWSCHVF